MYGCGAHSKVGPVRRSSKDQGGDSSDDTALAISGEMVEKGFRVYDMLDDHVRFLEGWFSDRLHGSPNRETALLRADGDLYKSSTD